MRRTMAVIGFVLFVTHLVLCTFGIRSAVWIAGAALLLFVIAAFVPRLRREPVLVCSLLAILAGCVTFYAAYAFQYLPLKQWDAKSVEVYAHPAGLATCGEYGEQIELRTDSIMGQPVRCKILLSTDKLPDMTDSDGLVFKAKVYLRQSPAANSHVWLYAGCASERIRVVPEPPSFSGRMLSARRYTRDTLWQVLPGVNGLALAGMLTGDSSALPERVYDSLRACGVLHLFAVSGFHLSVFSMALLRLFSRKRQLPRVAAVAAAIIVLFIMAMTGFSYSCVRAGVMILMMLVGLLIRKQADSLNSLGFALVLICATDAFSASDVGLQLSVLGVLCMILVSPLVDKAVRKVRFRPKRLARAVRRFLSVFLISASIQVFTLPVTVSVFRQFAPVSPLVNGFVLPAAQTAMIFSAMTVLFSLSRLFLPLFRLCGLAAGLLAKYCIAVCGFFGRISFVLTEDQCTLVCIWIAGVLLVCAVSIWIPMAARRRAAVISGVSALMLAACVLCGAWDFLGTATITIPSIDDASAFLLQSRGKSALLGCEYGVTDRKVSAFTSDIDWIWIPGLSGTDYEGCMSLAYFMPVRQVTMPGDPAHSVPGSGSRKIGAFDVAYLCDDDTAAAYAKVYSVSVLFLFGSDKVPQAMPQTWLDADVVCARGGLPHGMEPEKVGWILLSSGQVRSALLSAHIRERGGFVSSTTESGDLCLRIGSDGGLRLE